MRAYVALFVISTLLAQMVVPMETLALKRTAETIDYYGGIGGGLSGVISVNSSAATGVATMTGSITRTVVQTGYPTTPFVPVRVGGILFSLTPEQQTQIVNLVKTDKTRLNRSLQTAQNTILSSATQCTDKNVSTCIRNALKQAIQVTPAPIKAILIAIQKVIATPDGFYALLTASYPIIQQLSITFKSIKQILNNLLDLIKSPNNSRTKKEEDSSKKCKKKNDDYVFITEVLVPVQFKNKRYKKTVVICRTKTVPLHSISNDIQPLKEEIQKIFPLVFKTSGMVPKEDDTYLIIDNLTASNGNAYELRGRYVYKNSQIQINSEIVRGKNYEVIAHELSHLVSDFQYRNIGPEWKDQFFEEGLAIYVEKEYRKTKKTLSRLDIEQNEKRSYLKPKIKIMIDQMQKNMESSKKCFLSSDNAPFNKGKESLELNTHILYYHVSLLFIEFIKEQFNKKSVNIIHKLFDHHQGNMSRGNILQNWVVSKFQKNMREFCEGFFPYASRALNTQSNFNLLE